MFVTYSIVSHAQGHLVQQLLQDFRSQMHGDYEIIITLNTPEDESFLEDFNELPLRIIKNASPKGFGANHNAAFAISRGDAFAVVNPDIRLSNFSIQPCLNALFNDGVGACAPIVLSSLGTVEDSVRFYPTISKLVKRVVFKRRESDYNWENYPIQVDWAAGMFVVFRRGAFEQVKGFDERYFMYMEDADICRRLKMRGWQTVLQPATSVIHEAQRASRRSIKHFKWHLTSLFMFLIFN